MDMSSVEPAGPEHSRRAAASLLAAIATELGLRLARRGSPAWAGFETRHLQTIAQGALQVVIGLSDAVGNCQFDGYPYQLQQDGRYCCLNQHCVPSRTNT